MVCTGLNGCINNNLLCKNVKVDEIWSGVMCYFESSSTPPLEYPMFSAWK